MKPIRIQRQKGAVLFVSLMMLIVMSIIGVTAISGTSMEERMAHNFQHTALSFQATESAIQSIINAGDPGGAGEFENPFYNVNADPLVSSLSAGINVATPKITLDMDPDNLLGSATLLTDSVVTFRGTTNCPGASYGTLVCINFTVAVKGKIAATSTEVGHTQGITRPAPAPGV